MNYDTACDPRGTAEVRAELAAQASRIRAQDPTRYELLAFTLQAAVPLRMLELRDHPPQLLAAMAREKADVIAAQGDVLLYRGPGTAKACAALITAVACAALVADGGVTVLGLHWCTRPHIECPNRRGEG